MHSSCLWGCSGTLHRCSLCAPGGAREVNVGSCATSTDRCFAFADCCSYVTVTNTIKSTVWIWGFCWLLNSTTGFTTWKYCGDFLPRGPTYLLCIWSFLWQCIELLQLSCLKCLLTVSVRSCVVVYSSSAYVGSRERYARISSLKLRQSALQKENSRKYPVSYIESKTRKIRGEHPRTWSPRTLICETFGWLRASRISP